VRTSRTELHAHDHGQQQSQGQHADVIDLEEVGNATEALKVGPDIGNRQDEECPKDGRALRPVARAQHEERHQDKQRAHVHPDAGRQECGHGDQQEIAPQAPDLATARSFGKGQRSQPERHQDSRQDDRQRFEIRQHEEVIGRPGAAARKRTLFPP
jgi:hypothetical protein